MKQSEVKELSVEELSEKLGSLQKSLSDLKMTHAISPLENPIQLRFIKKTIARIKTELTNRSLQES
ncbi:MAG: 50S ribosomal protein L29 [Flavobacteriaceae bacterium]|nr:50S ribosomal protein L29 [Flavobacteriaceae bacterium]